MTPLELMREWLKSYPGAERLADFQVDYTDQVPGTAGLFPAGLVEIKRKTDICGNTTVTSQYNFAVYCVFAKSPGDDMGATINADWVMDFQTWVQTQSVQHKAPAFGDDLYRETIKAQNGALFDTSEEGVAIYMVQLSVEFIKKFEVNG